jgi:Flp pilus assembly protein TadD
VALHLEGKREAAARTLSKAIEEGERDPALYAALGHVQFELRDFEHAAASYRALVELDPAHHTAHYNLGVCLGNAQQWKQAADAFPQALAVDARAWMHTWDWASP